jgi:beta-aspartyl-peptidase (threonine type)
MRPTSIVLVLLCSSLSACVAPTGAEVKRTLDAQVAAWNQRDLPGYMAGYWKSDSLTFYSGGTITRGWQATLERYQQRYQGEGKEMGTLEFRELSIELVGPKAAIARGRWHLAMTGGKELAGLFTVVLEKLPEGWRIVHDHTSMQ